MWTSGSSRRGHTLEEEEERSGEQKEEEEKEEERRPQEEQEKGETNYGDPWRAALNGSGATIKRTSRCR